MNIITNTSQHAGAEGSREYPLHMAYTVKDMYDHLAGEGFRPMIIGWSLENPFPMIGGAEPPARASALHALRHPP